MAVFRDQGQTGGTQVSTDLMQSVRCFIKGAKSQDKVNGTGTEGSELCKTALALLRQLPACRTACFDFFCRVFHQAANNYIQGIETEINTGKLPPLLETDEVVITEIHVTLTSLIADNPTAWAPTISMWSLDLLGKISTRYAGRAHISANLNETLQLWMACRATHTLVDINTKCLSSLIHLNTEACISALLDTSVKHSPHFDWVVAHVGSCFPNTVITRVLSVGLKDFAQNRSYDQVCNSPKLKSVVGILGHLAGSHVQDIRTAIMELFNWSLKETFTDSDASRLQKKATVPYILQLAYLSSTLLSSICSETKTLLTTDIVGKLSHLTGDWIKYFGTPETLEDHLISLILKCETGGIHMFNLIISCAQITRLKGCNEDTKISIKEKSLEILESILLKIDESVRHCETVEIIHSCAKDMSELNRMLLSSIRIESEAACKLVIYLGHVNPTYLVKSATFLLESATTNEQLALLIKMLTNELLDKSSPPYNEKGGYFSVVLEQILDKSVPDLSQMWTNLLTLLKWEKSGKVSIIGDSITKAVEENFVKLTLIFSSELIHMHIIAEIIDESEMPNIESFNPPIRIILSLTQATVNYFFTCCKEEGTASKLQGFTKVCKILRRLCIYSKVAKVFALRELLERALFRSENVLFGAKNQVLEDGTEKSLLKQNKKFSKTIPLTKHSSVFNGGIIGRGKRKSMTLDVVSFEVARSNTFELINTLKACCAMVEEKKYSDISLDSMTLLSLLLVQFVSPDVMYNGLPWPEEEFSKVTIERDLFIRRMFTNIPLLWDLLSFVATYRPALCYCSVLLRALTATLIHQWKSMGNHGKSQDNENYTILMSVTTKVIDIMSLGQLLPPPLPNITNILPFLESYEVVDILRDCVWCYMRDHIPSPALFNRDNNEIHWRDPITARPLEIYTNTLRIIMQRRIKDLGHMYAQMFINLPKHE